MRSLTLNEATTVSGGGDIADATQVSAAIGGIVGAAIGAASGATGTAVLGAAGIGAVIAGGLVALGYVAWTGGSAFYEIPAVNGYIGDTLDSWFPHTPEGTVTVEPLQPSNLNNSGAGNYYNTPFPDVSDLPPDVTWTEWERMLVQGIL